MSTFNLFAELNAPFIFQSQSTFYVDIGSMNVIRNVIYFNLEPINVVTFTYRYCHHRSENYILWPIDEGLRKLDRILFTTPTVHSLETYLKQVLCIYFGISHVNSLLNFFFFLYISVPFVSLFFYFPICLHISMLMYVQNVDNFFSQFLICQQARKLYQSCINLRLL